MIGPKGGADTQWAGNEMTKAGSTNLSHVQRAAGSGSETLTNSGGVGSASSTKAGNPKFSGGSSTHQDSHLTGGGKSTALTAQRSPI